MRITVYRKTRKWMVGGENFDKVIVDGQKIESWLELQDGDYPGLHEYFKVEFSSISKDNDLCVIKT